MKKVVINALQYKKNSSGIGLMIRDLFGNYVKSTDNLCNVILSNDSPEFPNGKNSKQIREKFRYKQGIRRIAFQLFSMGRKYCKDSVLLITDSKTPLILPKSCVLIPVVTDLCIYRMPHAYQLTRVILWKIQYFYVKKRANHYVAISNATKEDIIKYLHIEPEKITVIPCACSREIHKADEKEVCDMRNKYNLPTEYILFVGTLNPRKNLQRIILAFDKLKTETSLPHKLVIAGEQGWKFDKEKALKGIINKKEIYFAGYVSDEDMSALYSGAGLFAFPSLYEGFGVPILEAQSCGTPVLAGNNSAMPEVGGNGAVYVNPYDVHDIYNGMRKVLQDFNYQHKIISLGYENVMKYSWIYSADRLGELVNQYMK